MPAEIREDILREDAHFTYGRTSSRMTPDEAFRPVGDWMRPKEKPWFVAPPHEICVRLGITSDVRRAADLANLFDGALDGYYYLAAASDGTEEAAKWLLGAAAAHLNEAGLPFSAIHRVMPADYLKTFVEYLNAGRFDRSFAKAVFAELLAWARSIQPVRDPPGVPGDDAGPARRVPGSEILDRIVADPRFRPADSSQVDAIIESVIEANPDNVARLAVQPKLLQWFVGQVMKAAGGKAAAPDVMARLRARLQLQD